MVEILPNVGRNANAGPKGSGSPGRREVRAVAVRKWFQYGEYVTIECDTDAGTAIVVEVK